MHTKKKWMHKLNMFQPLCIHLGSPTYSDIILEVSDDVILNKDKHSNVSIHFIFFDNITDRRAIGHTSRSWSQIITKILIFKGYVKPCFVHQFCLEIIGNDKSDIKKCKIMHFFMICRISHS